VVVGVVSSGLLLAAVLLAVVLLAGVLAAGVLGLLGLPADVDPLEAAGVAGPAGVADVVGMVGAAGVGFAAASDVSPTSTALSVVADRNWYLISAKAAPAPARTAAPSSDQVSAERVRLAGSAGLTCLAVLRRAEETLGATVLVTCSAASSSRGAVHWRAV
jgi:hypothetical protein